jgi:hypothetical protein
MIEEKTARRICMGPMSRRVLMLESVQIRGIYQALGQNYIQVQEET